MFEFHDYYERKDAQAEEAKKNSVKIDEEKMDETLKWAEEEELREAELAAQEAALAAQDAALAKHNKPDLPPENPSSPEEIDVNFSDI